MSAIFHSQLWPVGLTALRTTALIAIALVLILVVLPAALTAAGPGAPIAG